MDPATFRTGLVAATGVLVTGFAGQAAYSALRNHDRATAPDASKQFRTSLTGGAGGLVMLSALCALGKHPKAAGVAAAAAGGMYLYGNSLRGQEGKGRLATAQAVGASTGAYVGFLTGFAAFAMFSRFNPAQSLFVAAPMVGAAGIGVGFAAGTGVGIAMSATA